MSPAFRIIGDLRSEPRLSRKVAPSTPHLSLRVPRSAAKQPLTSLELHGSTPMHRPS
jgi:hypothetical protein